MNLVHKPRYGYCGSPEDCCGHYEVVYIACVVCQERWPCTTNRSHHSAAQSDRVKRWVDNRIGRAPRLTTRTDPS